MYSPFKILRFTLCEILVCKVPGLPTVVFIFNKSEYLSKFKKIILNEDYKECSPL